MAFEARIENAEYRKAVVMYCLVCDAPLAKRGRGRSAMFCSTRCRVAHHRRCKALQQLSAASNESLSLKGQLVLDTFPGGGLFGRAFEALGATVVRATDG